MEASSLRSWCKTGEEPGKESLFLSPGEDHRIFPHQDQSSPVLRVLSVLLGPKPSGMNFPNEDFRPSKDLTAHSTTVSPRQPSLLSSTQALGTLPTFLPGRLSLL